MEKVFVPPPPPLENVGPPLESCKMIVFFEINHLTSVKYAEDQKKTLSELFLSD